MKKKLADRVKPERLERASDILKAIAHPVRLEIIDLLRDNEKLSVTDIYEHLDLQQAIASHHLTLLKDKTVLKSEKNGKHIMYSLDKPQLLKVIECMEEFCKS